MFDVLSGGSIMTSDSGELLLKRQTAFFTCTEMELYFLLICMFVFLLPPSPLRALKVCSQLVLGSCTRVVKPQFLTQSQSALRQ